MVAHAAAADTYGRLPNAAELDAALGSDDVGHLTWRWVPSACDGTG